MWKGLFPTFCWQAIRLDAMLSSDMPPEYCQTINRAICMVQARALFLALVHSLAWGFASIGIVCVGMTGLHLLVGMKYPGVGLIELLGGAVVFGVVLVRGWLDPRSAAIRIDRGLFLKDRVLSSLAFFELDNPQPVHSLQVADTASRLECLQSRSLLPWLWRKDVSLLFIGCFLFLLSMLPRMQTEAVAVPVTPAPDLLVEVADSLEKQLEDVEKAVQGVSSEVVIDAVDGAKMLAASMREPGRALETALITLGQIRNQLEKAARNLDLAKQEAMLSSMAKALEADVSMKSISSALAQKRYREAAENMEFIAEQMPDSSSSFTKDNASMLPIAEEMVEQAEKADWEAMEKALRQFEEGLKKMNDSTCQDGMKRQAEEMRECAARKELAQRLVKQMNQLAQHNDQFSAACRATQQAQGEGAGEMGKKTGERGIAKSESFESDVSQMEMQAAGLGEHGNPYGDPTQLHGFRNEESLLGQLQEGPSTVQLERASEMAQFAGLDYREVHSRYKKMSEEVIEQEAIPLPYQPIVKRYFEAIRPRSQTSAEDVRP